MAQPIFEDDSPLDDYLKDTEIDVMPGTLPEFLQLHDVPHDIPHWVPSFILTLCQSLETSLYEPANPTTARQFAERFKYIIISSSLLSTYLSPTPTEAHGVPEPETPTVSDANEAPITTSAVLLYIICPICLASGYWMLALVALTLTTFVFKASTPLSGDKPLQTRLALQSLQGLIEADAAWESAVGEAMELLRRDESSGSMQWHTPLRVGLQSSLQAITTQVDRVRQLFSPLTAPMELAQMTEMYAPPSPTNLHQTLAQQQQDSPTSKIHKSPSSSRLDKRITWSGTASKQFYRRSMGPDSISPDTSLPVPPVPRIPSSGDQDVTFGTLALDLQRNRTTPQRHSMAVTPRSAISLRPSPTAVSRFTTMQSMRNPLSMSSLDSALQAALSSKRYTCAYLLALRFDEEEDDLYWEDVRSVISLLSTSLEDETARLSEAMDDWHKGRQRDARPSVVSTPSATPSPAESSAPIPIPSSNASQRRRRDVVSFAPQSTDMEKMSGHMQSIAGNLDHAFDELESCVTSLQRHDVTLSNDDDAANSLETSAQAAMSAYEALRRELGLAIRECERARGPLLSILSKRSGPAMEMGEDDELHREDESMNHRPEEDSFPLDSPTRNGASSPPPAYVSRGPSQIVDDATAHLLAGATALNLPPPGVDKIYEADSGPVVKPYKKERSILSRQERILLAQAKRRSMRAPSPAADAVVEEPKATSPFALGGDVVEELKEVIKNVNERKQRMAMLPPRRAALEDSVPIFDASLQSPGGRTILTSTGSEL